MAALVMLAMPVAAAGQATDRWRFTVTPYVWLPAIDGSLRYGPPAIDGATPIVDLDAETILEAIDGALMVTMEARRDRWLVRADYLYVDLEADNSDVRSIDFGAGTGDVDLGDLTVDTGTSTAISGSVWSLLVGREIAADHGNLALVGGFRELNLDFKTDWRLSAAESSGRGTEFAANGTIDQGDSLTDFVVGVRGRIEFDGPWFVPYHVDAGTGDSRFSWQAVAGVGHKFGFGDLLFVYRYLAYDVEDNALLEDLRMAGISAGVSFRF